MGVAIFPFLQRGQASVEQLAVFSAVLVIALLAVALLSGWFGTGMGFASDSEQYWAATGPIAISKQVQQGNTLYLTFFNRESSWLKVDSIAAGNVSATLDLKLNAGEARTVAISGFTPCSASYDSYSYQTTIVFSSFDLAGQVKRGEKPLAGKCQQ